MNKEFIARWFHAFLVTLGVFALFSFYLFIRREMYNLGIANKAFGSAAAILAGITLAIGPLARFRPALGIYIPYRRPLGVFAFVTGLTHAVISMFFLPQRFPLTFYQSQWPATITGLVAIVIWAYLATISRNQSLKQLGPSKWVMIQQWGGHIAFIAVFFHLIFLKWAGWIEWFQGKTQKTAFLANPGYPPASLFVFLIMTGIIGYRVYLKIKHHVRP